MRKAILYIVFLSSTYIFADDFDEIRNYGQFKCSFMECDFKWDSPDLVNIDYNSICHDLKNTEKYTHCRNEVINEFKFRCERGKKKGLEVWIKTYCKAATEYKP